jgi:GTP pyrophosphokinase
MSFSEFTPEDYAVIEREWEHLRESARKRCANEAELEVVQRAFDFANSAHRNVRRRSGEPYMLHPIAVAQIVVDNIGLGYKSISAALLHDVVEDTDYTTEDIQERFGPKIATLVDGLTKIKNVLDTEQKTHGTDISQQSLQAENFKRILLTLNDDVRVVLIKLADRLHNCRTIEHMPEHKRDKILSETMFIFIPLAHRLGLYSIKSELENIWLRYKEPDAYKEVKELIERKIEEKGAEMAEFVVPIQEMLKKAGYTFEVKTRVKTPYSVWKKMKDKGITFDEVYDLYAIRIIFEPKTGIPESEREQCFNIYALLTDRYIDRPERKRDWVKHPKANGYEALHCTLLSDAGLWVEVQIRSRRMDDIAEKGIAAHWVYKKHGIMGEGDYEMDAWIDHIKEILTNPDVNALELLDIIHNDLTSTVIYVFTPKGEQRSIQKGATALDFAYLIHTEIGNKAIAAKVNHKLVKLNQTLKTGDKVEIITAQDAKPSPQWLEFLTTHRARTLVSDYFKSRRKLAVDYGRSQLEATAEALGVKLDEPVLQRLDKAFKMPSRDDLFYEIGIGTVHHDKLEDTLKQFTSSRWSLFKRKPAAPKEEEKPAQQTPEEKGQVIVASCCNPIPGDPVIGFRAPDGTVTVHKKTCPVAESIAATHGDWVVVPEWPLEGEDKSFLVRINIKGLDRRGLLNEITRLVSYIMESNMRRLNLQAEGGLFDGYIDLSVSSRENLEQLIKKLSSIDGIEKVTRSDL